MLICVRWQIPLPNCVFLCAELQYFCDTCKNNRKLKCKNEKESHNNLDETNKKRKKKKNAKKFSQHINKR